MAGEDYRDDNGVALSKKWKERKIESGNKKFNSMMEKYDIDFQYEYNNVICFKIKDNTYYYGKKSKKIRSEGLYDWTTKIVDKLKNDFNNKIPLRQKSS